MKESTMMVGRALESPDPKQTQDLSFFGERIFIFKNFMVNKKGLNLSIGEINVPGG